MLDSAAKQGMINVIQHIRTVQPSNVKFPTDLDRMLKYAASRNHLKTVIYLVHLGANINKVSGPSASNGHIEILLWALHNGAKHSTNYKYSEGLYTSIELNNDSAARKFYNLCTDPLEFCLNQDNVEILNQIKHLATAC